MNNDFKGDDLKELQKRRTDQSADTPPTANRWIVIGSGPSGHDLTRQQLADSTVICVNSCIAWTNLDDVDYYLYRGGQLHKRFNEFVAAGIKLITFKRGRGRKWYPRQSIAERSKCLPLAKRGKWDQAEKLGLPKWCRHVENLRHTDYGWDCQKPIPKYEWRLGTYTELRDPAGPQGIQYALNHGATHIEIYGIEGGERDTHGGVPLEGDPDRLIEVPQAGKSPATATARRWAEVNVETGVYHKSIIQACVDACPDVRFVQHGDPLYLLEGPNVQHKLTKTRPATRAAIVEADGPEWADEP